MPPFPVLPYTDAPQQDTQDESGPEALVARLLASLERGTTEPPPALSGSRRLLGPLGDALMAAATVRAGGAPPQIGAFGAEQAARQAAYERRLEENARADRSLRNSIRVGVSQGMIRRHPQLRMVQTTDEAGNPITVPMEYNPADGSLAPLETTAGQGSFQKFVPPKTLPTTEGYVRVAGNGPLGTIKSGESGKPLMPVPSAQLTSDITTQENLRGAFETAAGMLTPYLQERSATSRVVTGAATNLPVVGGMATQLLGYSDPQSINTKQSLDRVSQILNYLVSGKQISEQEYARLRPNIPELGDAPDVASGKMDRFRAELGRIEATRGRILPGLSGSANNQNPGGATPGQFVGRSLPASAFDKLPENVRAAERQRFIGGGGTILEGQ